jgi:hypothetical protein
VTLAVVFKGPEGIALAADSRVTLRTQAPGSQDVIFSYFDNATKLLEVEGQDHVGAVMYGMAAIGNPPRTVAGYITEFEEELKSSTDGRLAVADIAARLGQFYTQQWREAGMPDPVPGTGVDPLHFLVAGFDQGEPYGRVYQVSVPMAPEPAEQYPGGFGPIWGGQLEFAGRLLSGVDPRAAAIAKEHLNLTDEQEKSLQEEWARRLTLAIPGQFLSLQDCVDLSAFLVTMTSAVQTWTTQVRGVGGAVDVATITRTEGFRAIQRKKIEVRA